MPERVVLGGITQAVRERRPDELLDELVRDLDSGSKQWRADPRDLMMALAPYLHAATAIGAPDLLLRAADRAPDDLADVVRTFAANATIEPSAWDFAVDQEAEGVVYSRERWTPADEADLLRRIQGDR